MVRGTLAIPIAAKAWAGILMLAAVPIYIRYLGVDAFGVVGLFTTAAAMLSVLDLGMPAWLTREFAGAAENQKSSRLVILAHSMDWLAALAVLVVVAAGALFVHNNPPVIQGQPQLASTLLGVLALAVQWPGNLYAGMLAGQQRHTTAALVAACSATLRVGLTVGGLWLAPSLMVFFGVQAAVSILQTLILRKLANRDLPHPGLLSRPDTTWIGHASGFASAMTLMGVLSLTLSQIDKVLVGHIVPLPEFGIYMLGWTLAGGLSLLAVAPMASVALAWLSNSVIRTSEAETWRTYQQLTAWMVTLIVPPAAVIALAPSTILGLWGMPAEVTSSAARLLPWLIAGTAINGIMTIPYTLQIAHGWVQLPLKMNALALIALLPVLAWGTTTHGVQGAAFGWLVTNGVFALIWPGLMHRRLLPGRLTSWLKASVALPSVAGVGAAAGLIAVSPPLGSTPAGWQAVTMLGAWLIGVLATVVASPQRGRLFLSIYRARRPHE